VHLQNKKKQKLLSILVWPTLTYPGYHLLTVLLTVMRAFEATGRASRFSDALSRSGTASPGGTGCGCRGELLRASLWKAAGGGCKHVSNTYMHGSHTRKPITTHPPSQSAHHTYHT
jgi:hypothetical protein